LVIETFERSQRAYPFDVPVRYATAVEVPDSLDNA